MQIEMRSDTDRECKDLIGEAYEAAHTAGWPDGMFSGGDELWEKVEEVLARKGTLDLSTTGDEDSQAENLFEEVFEEASRTAEEDGFPTRASEYVDYQQLWERACAILGVSV